MPDRRGLWCRSEREESGGANSGCCAGSQEGRRGGGWSRGGLFQEEQCELEKALGFEFKMYLFLFPTVCFLTIVSGHCCNISPTSNLRETMFPNLT